MAGPRWAQRYNVGPIISNHYAGFTAFETSKPTSGSAPASSGGRPSRRADWIILFWLPVAVGLGCGWANVEIVAPAALLTASSLLIGATLSLFVFVVNLRIKISETDKLKKNRRLHKLVAYSASSCLYVALVALVATVALALYAGVHISWLSGHGLVRITYGLVFALLSHLTLTLVTVVRRIFGIYYDIFAADFAADLQPVQDSDDQPRRDQTA